MRPRGRLPDGKAKIVLDECKIAAVSSHVLADLPITPPPGRRQPDRTDVILTRVTTEEGITGWSMANHAHPLMVSLVNDHLAALLAGESAYATERIQARVGDQRPDAPSQARGLGRILKLAMSNIDVALWDIRGKAQGLPLWRLLGGARTKVPVYITFGAAYGGAPPYGDTELVEEAEFFVEQGIHHLKNTVGRTTVDGEVRPDPASDAARMGLLRRALGTDIKLSMDGNSRMSLAEASALCVAAEKHGIEFIEEPIVSNDPQLLRRLRDRTSVAVAVAETPKYGAIDYIRASAADVIQPNVVHDGGFTGALKVAAAAEGASLQLGHGNGAGPHNVPLHAGLHAGRIVEYHYHKWMAYNAVFESVPQPRDGFVHVTDEPGLDLDPKPEILRQIGLDPGLR